MAHDTETQAAEQLDARMLAASIALQPEVKLPLHTKATKHRAGDDAVTLPPTKFIGQEDAQHIHRMSRPLAQARERIAALQAEMNEVVPGRNLVARRQALYERISALQQEADGDARGAARSSVIASLDALIKRAAASYTAAAHMVAEEAARYQAVCELRDEALRTSKFDPLGTWGRVGALLAPEPAHRPAGWSVVTDVYQRECIWTASSDPHRRAVERNKAEIKSELRGALNGAGWPFEGGQ